MRAIHGVTNRVTLDLVDRTVRKEFSPLNVGVLWRSAQREFAALTIVAPLGLAPPVLAFDGHELRQSMHAGQSYPEAYRGLDLAGRRGLARNAGFLLRRIHQVGWDGSPPWSDLALAGARPQGWRQVIAQIIGDLARLTSDRMPHLGSVPVTVEQSAERCAAGLPDEVFGLVHGDFGGANVLVGPGGDAVAVDWEWAHLGDPVYDLVRHDWLDAVGRHHHLYDESTATAFADGYGAPIHADADRFHAYGTVLALGHLLTERNPDRAARLVEWLAHAHRTSP
jgi:aminoglycoside phosphotransferase (APT) family kinase protein